PAGPLSAGRPDGRALFRDHRARRRRRARVHLLPVLTVGTRSRLLPSLALMALVGAGECGISARAGRQQPTLGSRETIWLERTRELRAQAAPVDVVFLGDSTVERAIDDQLVGEESGLTALNLGLTGDLGTYGDYAILKRYLRRLPPPRALVVWHAVDVWGRDVDPQL